VHVGEWVCGLLLLCVCVRVCGVCVSVNPGNYLWSVKVELVCGDG